MGKRIFEVGDIVKLIEMPHGLIHDLPIDVQVEMKSFVGLKTEITKINPAGYYWLGFGETTEEGDIAHYSGHSFCVKSESIEKV